MDAILKFIHIAAVAIWMAGLVSLPGLFVQRARIADARELERLHRMVRHAYLALISPAAFVAIASGTVLIFLSVAFEPWLSAKLALVGLLVLVHILAGLVIIRLFDRGETYPAWRFIAETIASLGLVASVLYFVLAKPELTVTSSAMTEPGGLARMLGEFNPWRKP